MILQAPPLPLSRTFRLFPGHGSVEEQRVYSSTPRESLGRRGGACPPSLWCGHFLSHGCSQKDKRTGGRGVLRPPPPPLVTPGIFTWRETSAASSLWGAGLFEGSSARLDFTQATARGQPDPQRFSRFLPSPSSSSELLRREAKKGEGGGGQEKGARGARGGRNGPVRFGQSRRTGAFVPDFLGKSCHAGRPGSSLTSAGQMWRSPAPRWERQRWPWWESLSFRGRGQPAPPRWRRAMGGVTQRSGEKEQETGAVPKVFGAPVDRGKARADMRRSRTLTAQAKPAREARDAGSSPGVQQPNLPVSG